MAELRNMVSTAKTASVLLALITLASLLALSTLRIDHRTEQLFASNTESYRQYTAFKTLFPHHGGEIVVIVQGELMQPASLQALAEATRRLATDPDIYTSLSIASVPAINRSIQSMSASTDRAEISTQIDRLRKRLSTPTYPPSTLLSDDLNTTLLVLQTDATTPFSIDRRSALIKRIDAALGTILSDSLLTWSLTGFPVIEQALQVTTQTEHAVLGLSALVVAALIIQFFLRQVPLTITTLAGPLCGLAWAWGLCALMGIEINLLTRTITALLLVITTSDALHFTRFIQARTDAGNQYEKTTTPEALARHCWRVVAPACVITTITTMAGFLSLYWVDSQALREFGLVAALAVLCGLIASLLMVPLTAYAAIQSRRNQKFNQQTARRTRHRIPPIRPLSKHYDRFIIRLFIVFLTASGIASFSLNTDYRIGENLNRDSEAMRGFEHSAAQVDGLLPLSILVRWPTPFRDSDTGNKPDTHIVLAQPTQNRTASEAERLRDLRKITRTLNEATDYQWLSIQHLAQVMPGLNTPLKIATLPPAIKHQVYLPDAGAALVSTRINLSSAQEIQSLLAVIETALASMDGDTTFESAIPVGVTALIGIGTTPILKSLTVSLLVAIAIIALLLGVLLRSVTLSITALLLGVTPLAAITWVLIVMGEPVRFASSVVYLMMIGLGVDNAVHLIARVRYLQRLGHDRQTAIHMATQRVGAVLLLSSLVLFAGFATLLIAQTPTIALIGVLSMVAVSIALAADLTVLPALLRSLPRRKNTRPLADSSQP